MNLCKNTFGKKSDAAYADNIAIGDRIFHRKGGACGKIYKKAHGDKRNKRKYCPHNYGDYEAAARGFVCGIIAPFCIKPCHKGVYAHSRAYGKRYDVLHKILDKGIPVALSGMSTGMYGRECLLWEGMEMLKEMESQNGLTRVITLKASLFVPGALEGETVRAWLPVAATCRQQSQVEILDMTPEGAVAPANASARTASWSSSSERSFSVTYRYQINAAYRDIYGGALPSHPCMDAPLPEDISEDRPHIAFTPYLQQLTAGVVDGLEDPLDRARAIYDYLTQHIDYRYQPPYLLLGSIADDCAHSLRGDCGVMALTFITMCRIAGVPARWQSGLYVAPDSVGSHDWAEFYTPQTGWLNADVSFGSSARRMGEEWRRRHYFGNLDPWRMVANNRFQAEFEPSFDGMREDPYDNQMGEASVDGRGCRQREMLRTVELIEMLEVPFSD